MYVEDTGGDHVRSLGKQYLAAVLRAHVFLAHSSRHAVISSHSMGISRSMEGHFQAELEGTAPVNACNPYSKCDKYFWAKYKMHTSSHKKIHKMSHPKLSSTKFGVDSFEDYKMWYEEDFIKLSDLLFEKKLFDYIYLVCSPEKSHIAKKIITESNKNYFIDCSNKDLQGVILAIKNSDFFLGNNSGPLNLAAALGIKSFGLIANDPVSELKYSKIIPIVPKDYVDNVWHRDRNGMKNLKPDEVFNQVIENL